MDQLLSEVEQARPVSLQEVKDWFESHGVVISEWAVKHGFEAAHVYAVLGGKARGRRGNAHRIAVALGLKVERRIQYPRAATAFGEAPVCA